MTPTLKHGRYSIHVLAWLPPSTEQKNDVTPGSGAPRRRGTEALTTAGMTRQAVQVYDRVKRGDRCRLDDTNLQIVYSI